MPSLCAAGLDVYEEETDLYLKDHCDGIICDDSFERLTTFSNVIIIGYQPFFTREAMKTNADTTIQNLDDLSSGKDSPNRVAANRTSHRTGGLCDRRTLLPAPPIPRITGGSG